MLPPRTSLGRGRGITGTLGINDVAVDDYDYESNSRLSHPHVLWNILFGYDY